MMLNDGGVPIGFWVIRGEPQLGELVCVTVLTSQMLPTLGSRSGSEKFLIYDSAELRYE